jgi:hypothetical protein
MDNFSLWTKQNIIDIIFDFNEKNDELLRDFINWYIVDNNFIYILSNRDFYSVECLKLLLNKIKVFIDVKNNDIILEEKVIQKINIDEKNNDIILEEINIDEKIDVIQQKDIDEKIEIKEIDVIQQKDIDEKIEIEEDSDDYVINDENYCNKDDVEIVHNNTEEVNKNTEGDVEKNNTEEEVDKNTEGYVEKNNTEEEVDKNTEGYVEKNNTEEEVGDKEDYTEEDVEEEVDDKEDDTEEDVEDAEENLIINKFSNNEIILLLNILEEDIKKFRNHTYIINKYKEQLYFYNIFYKGFTTGILVYFLLKLI